MGTALNLSLITEDQYLQTSFHPDRDFEDGLVMERTLGQYDHSNLQAILSAIFVNNRKNWGVRVLVEQRLRVRRGKYRIPDLLIVPLGYDPRQKVVVSAPLLCIEILSPDDKMPSILKRVWEYTAMGVPEVWIFDPEARTAFIARHQTVSEVKDAVLRSGNMEISCREVFAAMDEV
jgi:Uma2 family endonuclease